MIEYNNLTPKEIEELQLYLNERAVLSPSSNSSKLVTLETALKALDIQAGKLRERINKLEVANQQLSDQIMCSNASHMTELKRANFLKRW